jgi:peptidoglycan hydrolase-like protein with peptidoglycan-binding domain
MEPRDIRLGMMAAAAVVITVTVNLLVMQPVDGRGPRPDRAYRGLSALPGTRSTTVLHDATAASKDVEAQSKGEATLASSPAPARQKPAAPAARTDLIRELQQQLTRRGYVPGEANGALGMVTRAAIMAFEHDRRLPLTAEPSQALLAELRSDAPLQPALTSPVRPGPEAMAIIRTVQQSLARLDYKVGTADGLIGEMTVQAIRAYERSNELPETGRVSGLLLTTLAESAGTGRVAER